MWNGTHSVLLPHPSFASISYPLDIPRQPPSYHTFSSSKQNVPRKSPPFSTRQTDRRGLCKPQCASYTAKNKPGSAPGPGPGSIPGHAPRAAPH